MLIRQFNRVVLMLLWGALIWQTNAQENLRIAVLDFQNLTGREELQFLEKAIPQILITDLTLCSKVTIVERARLQEILDEMQLALSGIIDEKNAIKVGEVVNANTILVGGIVTAGENYRIDCRLIDVASSTVLLAVKKDWLSENDIIQATDELAQLIIQKLTGEVLKIYPDFKYEPMTFDEDRILTIETALDQPVWLNKSDKPVYLQVDIYSKGGSFNQRIPLNIALVLDRSGSMATENKLDHVKQAAKYIVQNLDRQDVLSIVLYDAQVHVMVPAQPVSNKQKIISMIDKINTGTTTNLSGGLLQGYSEVAKYLKTGQVNRVLLLSDGLANEGIIRRDKLQEICAGKMSAGISVSTFGVGADYDEDLLQGMADYGSGNYFFIGSPEQIPTIFSRELTGLLTVVAQNVRIELETAPGVEVENVFGFSPWRDNNRTVVTPGDIFANDHFTVTFQLRLPDIISDSLQLANVSLTYDDVVNKGDRVKTVVPVTIKGTSNPDERDLFQNPYVGEHIALLSITQKVQNIIQTVNENNIPEIRESLNDQLVQVSNAARQYKSTELKKQILTINKYSQALDLVENKPKVADRTGTSKPGKPSVGDEIRILQKAAKYDTYQQGKGKTSEKDWFLIPEKTEKSQKEIVPETKSKPTPNDIPQPTPPPIFRDVPKTEIKPEEKKEIKTIPEKPVPSSPKPKEQKPPKIKPQKEETYPAKKTEVNPQKVTPTPTVAPDKPLENKNNQPKKTEEKPSEKTPLKKEQAKSDSTAKRN